ncbi:MAG: endonuclease III [Beijerinckiaceae bacterium]
MDAGDEPRALTPSAKDFRGAAETAANGGYPRPTLLADAEVSEFFRRLHAIEPEPKGELEHVNAFTLLVAVVLSAQATDAGVNKATRRLFEIADTPAKMLALGEDAVREHVKTIGLYRNKAKNVVLLSQRLIDEKNGEVPADRDYLTTLPGVGRKTANVVLNMAFGIPTMAVDTHVFRVANRLPLVIGRTPEEVEERLLARLPAKYALHAHHWLILHGRYTCKARAPECGRCTVSDLCRSPEKIV